MKALLLKHLNVIDQAAWAVYRRFSGRVWLDDLKSASAYGATLAAARISLRPDAARMARKTLYREARHYAMAEARQTVYGVAWPTKRRESLVSLDDTKEQSYELLLPFDPRESIKASGCSGLQATVIVLSVINELPRSTVARHLGVTRKTVYRALRNGLHTMRTAKELTA